MNIKYLVLTIALFATEVYIGAKVHDNIIRPYIGDLLISVFIYTFIKAFFNRPIFSTAFWVLLYCYAVEISQHFNLIGHLGLQDSKMAYLLLGSYFSWIDMACYTAGITIVLILEHIEIKAFTQNASA